ncbi:MAG: hypothetical protein EAZ53_04530 [Bacteroidetes bacterium]|nr:MAG: hypothetical protein EAZ53_04530 [Bacteroidota bacterium]
MLWGLAMPDNEGKKSVDLQENMGYTQIYKGKNGGTLHLHKDANPDEIGLLTKKGKIMADYGHKVEIRPYYENNEGIKNPDYNINGKIADLKSPLKATNVKNRIEKDIADAKLQNSKILILELDNPILTKKDLKRAIGGKLTNIEHYKIIEEVWLLGKKNKLYTMTRKDITNKNYLGIIDAIPNIPME